MDYCGTNKWIWDFGMLILAGYIMLGTMHGNDFTYIKRGKNMTTNTLLNGSTPLKSFQSDGRPTSSESSVQCSWLVGVKIPKTPFYIR